MKSCAICKKPITSGLVVEPECLEELTAGRDRWKVDAEKSGLNALASEIHTLAVEKGWYEEKRSFPEVIALMHSELSEALEEYRAGKEAFYLACKLDGVDKNDECDDVGRNCYYRASGDEPCDNEAPAGIAIELADCIIRILDTCVEMGIDIDAAVRQKHEYNKSRPCRHGGKRC